MSLEELVQELINDGKGDTGRLEHILSTLKKGESLYASDQEYLQKLLAESKNSDNSESIKELDTKEETESEHSTQEQLSEIDLLRKEIHKLQDKNHIIEEHLRKQGGKKGSMARAFGRGLGGVFLFLFGLGMVLLTYAHFDNLDNSMRGMGYGADPMATMIYFIIVVPTILLIIAGASIYYGIRIISKT